MAPSTRMNSEKKLQLKKKLQLRQKNIQQDKWSNSNNVVSEMEAGGCSTPKGKRFRIPEIETCPPAPKKQRVLSNCSFKRTPIAFFAPPELELFFLFQQQPDISV